MPFIRASYGQAQCVSTSAPTSATALHASAASALVLSTGIAVLVGNQASRWLDMVPLKLIAGIGFIAIGCWAIVEQFRGA